MKFGSITSRGVEKRLSNQDQQRLEEGVVICREILKRFGAEEKDIFLGTVIAGHPGGMLPLTEKEAVTMHSERLPENLYVADATLLPKSLGQPTHSDHHRHGETDQQGMHDLKKSQ